MTEIIEEYMKQTLTNSKNYTLVILKATKKLYEPGNENIKFEHGERNFQLRKDGLLSIVCRITDKSNIKGVAIFNCGEKEVEDIMEGDPGVMAGIFTYEIHQCTSFEGDKLP
jgi:hypothetical protein